MRERKQSKIKEFLREDKRWREKEQGYERKFFVELGTGLRFLPNARQHSQESHCASVVTNIVLAQWQLLREL